MPNSMIKTALYGLAVAVLFSCSGLKPESGTRAPQQQQLSGNIRLNQVGFYPNATKLAVVVGDNSGGKFFVKSTDLQKTLYTGQLTEPKANEFSGRPTRVADFSAFTAAGSYVLVVPEVGHSYPFEIKQNVHREAAAAAIKGFYFQRVSVELPERYAGQWARPAGHPDKNVLVHPSAASAQRPAGTVLSSPRGWYDAGDYNKYIVNSGITMGTLLAAYEDFPEYFASLELNIPESGNGVPDLLDESLWNLRWMLTMQDPHDGGVYHKLTNPAFDGMVMPDAATNPRYVVQKGTAAALDFAAVMAQASRVYRTYSREYPGLADSCLAAATSAWQWARKNPAVRYEQDTMNKQFKPEVTTGAYGDRELSDEFIWAAAELYATTKQDSFYTAVNMLPDQNMPLPSWAQVRLLGYYTLVRLGDSLTPVGRKALPEIKARMVGMADALLDGVDARTYRTVMGKTEKDYVWGSSAVAANQGIALLQAYRLTNDKKYIRGAVSNLDYLLGRNATGYSFLTGFGGKPTLHPHHRPSIADGIADPVPGLLSGGTNARADKQDNCTTYSSTFPDEMYTDDDCSYASNEIAINWNAPFVYLAGGLEALQAKGAL
ncbi:glycoside hydrolase family 9 protein [Pontibacter sp. E15-1]|uniref:glycoside hydrolase family 9 protein n=1 Tax=Pontibacter sp. E15-1 TaxID=2919918 RepID=UPI001F4FF68F|nr:glycoside hydrolase family 9 protein [Pontibacter sp. E15-1]MCJ8165871.1 glycoside hydrolase family 9 protein [Pontibacter sp. E15-1]